MFCTCKEEIAQAKNSMLPRQHISEGVTGGWEIELPSSGKFLLFDICFATSILHFADSQMEDHPLCIFVELVGHGDKAGD